MRLLGWEPMPWQRDVLDVAFEIDPETGMLWYSEIVIIVPRQSGKSSLVIPWGMHRMMMWPDRQYLLYIAQTRAKALEKLVEEHHHRILGSKFKGQLVPNRRGATLHLSHGDEHMRFRNGSKWAIDAPTEDAGHGGTLGLTIGDEVFAQKDDRLEAALLPATTAVPDSQSMWISTVGESKAKSPFLWKKAEAGRARSELLRADPRALNNPGYRTLYVEYSAPEDADPDDPLTWWACMPALGFTTTVGKIAVFRDTMKDGFYRPFLNWWGDDLASDWKIPEERWAVVGDADSQIARPELVYVVDISPDRDWASIVVAGVNKRGQYHVEVVSDGPGTGWLVHGEGDGDDRLIGLRELLEHDPGAVYYEHKTTGTLLPDLVAAEIEAEPMPAADMMVAAPGLLDLVLNKRVAHLEQAELTDALAAAQTSKVGDGWKWVRGKSLRPITALVAASYAVRMLALKLPDLAYDPVAALRAANSK
ncbi:hypothetical protein BKA24_001681 [Microbacterium marinum]|uniref:Phage terminase-like protein, large subunit, contains N-terminal HTH domain n=1 Tax=Microbacterium marinum TaxID=421115 RepID=A0A7W7BQI5_9MICO|nr:terminase large subunit [Microbacterium marinum]MBB4666972.1 hypothetical protein [Microbacterium marinum]